jgi:hypothetical protein
MLGGGTFVYIESKSPCMEFDPAQVSSRVPTQDVAPLTFYYDGTFISGEL